ncbi:MAG: hypothetical protein K9J85_08680, partial [Desulfobacteraceae bacterium]|nr:hypothetical protein [Desulfobacteraceae bacterium]
LPGVLRRVRRTRALSCAQTAPAAMASPAGICFTGPHAMLPQRPPRLVRMDIASGIEVYRITQEA